ncbi:hypothetical protein ACVWZK_007940 [Bradyrhizobium sp. GM0.4]
MAVTLFRNILLSSVALIGAASPANSQSNQSGTRLTIQGPAEQSNGPVVRNALGRPCLDVEAAARQQVVNPKMVDHVVSLKNNCPRVIHAKVCYFNSDRCNELTLTAYKRIDTILGTMSGITFFRYSIVQK